MRERYISAGHIFEELPKEAKKFSQPSSKQQPLLQDKQSETLYPRSSVNGQLSRNGGNQPKIRPSVVFVWQVCLLDWVASLSAELGGKFVDRNG